MSCQFELSLKERSIENYFKNFSIQIVSLSHYLLQVTVTFLAITIHYCHKKNPKRLTSNSFIYKIPVIYTERSLIKGI